MDRILFEDEHQAILLCKLVMERPKCMLVQVCDLSSPDTTVVTLHLGCIDEHNVQQVLCEVGSRKIWGFASANAMTCLFYESKILTYPTAILLHEPKPY